MQAFREGRVGAHNIAYFNQRTASNMQQSVNTALVASAASAFIDAMPTAAAAGGGPLADDKGTLIVVADNKDRIQINAAVF
ncbi:MAG: hypothetical protein P4L81_00210 [Candidatus Pacebacteria bacterium]|nr:hypothetical protein [Candidatus Paceibacterota bacterium]